MKRECYQYTIQEVSLNITAGYVDSIRKKNITKTGCRVYDNGCIGVAGVLGEATEETWKAAEEALQDKVPYPYEPTAGGCKVRDLRGPAMSEQEFLAEMEDCLATLRTEHPDFVFSNKIQLFSTKEELQNDTGLSYVNQDSTVLVEVLMKHVDSVNVFDGFLSRIDRTFEKEAFLQEARDILKSFRNPVDMPELNEDETLPVILSPSHLLGKFASDLNGEQLGGGSSLFTGHLGEKLFSDHFTLVQDVSAEHYHVPFFDMEGFDREANPVTFVDKGVVKQGYTHKKSAAQYDMPLTGAADCGYDGVPMLSVPPMSVVPDARTLKELLNGQLGIWIMVASGGDYTNEGNYGAPVQLAMLTDGERLLGRVPECTIAGNLYELFGKDYIGVSNDKPFFGENMLLVKMKVTK